MVPDKSAAIANEALAQKLNVIRNTVYYLSKIICTLIYFNVPNTYYKFNTTMSVSLKQLAAFEGVASGSFKAVQNACPSPPRPSEKCLWEVAESVVL